MKFTNKSSFKSPYRCYFLKRNPQHFSPISILRDDFSGHNISWTQGAWVCATRLRMFFFMVFSKRASLWQSQRVKWKSLVVIENRPNHSGWSAKADMILSMIWYTYYIYEYIFNAYYSKKELVARGYVRKKSSCWIAIIQRNQQKKQCHTCQQLLPLLCGLKHGFQVWKLRSSDSCAKHIVYGI